MEVTLIFRQVTKMPQHMATVGRNVLGSERYIGIAIYWIARPIEVSYVGMRRLERKNQ